MDWLSSIKGKKIFITGHTGFKGAWLCKVLCLYDIEVAGYALDPPTEPSLFKILRLENRIRSHIGDIRDLAFLRQCLTDFAPDIVIHMAAQPLVCDSYLDPVGTYQTNVMGTVNILEAIRKCRNIKHFLNVTTDKVYRNNEWARGYHENDVLDGFDPYSNSKSCSELVTSAYRRSFYQERDIKIVTARAGNVIGGGDFAINRIIPDCFRAAKAGSPIKLRNPHSIRPYQHVLEPLLAYLLLVTEGAEGAYNVGPDDGDCVSTRELVEIFTKYWSGTSWEDVTDPNAPHEARVLCLDSSKIKQDFGWHPIWNIDQAIKKTVEWHQSESPETVMAEQIYEYVGCIGLRRRA